ncbi:MAG: triose-phosphate isomerase, partial [Erythrobacter sp.]
LGHSERRQSHREGNPLVKAKAESALTVGLRVIMCCGETNETREKGDAVSFVTKQLKASLPVEIENPTELLSVAYEPIWAIGTGKTAQPADIEEMHSAIRALLISLYGEEHGGAVRILYGGSVKPENASEIFAVRNVGGALVGGASLTADSFMGIALAAGETTEA